MSGGVDSSVAAHLLSLTKEDILGIHMSNWDYHSDDDISKEQKCWEQDWKDAQAVAQHLDIPIVHTSVGSRYNPFSL
jgi:tRNA-specific 2-thiouridylase